MHISPVSEPSEPLKVLFECDGLPLASKMVEAILFVPVFS